MNYVKYALLLLTVFVTSGHGIRCHQCPLYERRDAAKCLKSIAECEPDLSCFFEYRGKWLNLGCGREWERPTGCHGGKCIHWCHSNLCNKRLLRKAPFDIPGVDQAAGGSGGFFSMFSNSTPKFVVHVLAVAGVVAISLLLSM